MSQIDYDCYVIHKIFNGMKIHTFPFDNAQIPENGIYILFERGEPGHGMNRIVRIGTHTGKNQLRSRLKQHFMTENKDRSIFRKNIGRAILNRDKDPFFSQWDVDLTTKASREIYKNCIDFTKQAETEKKVSHYIQNNFSFVVFQVDEKEKRLDLESKIISTVSLCTECGPSKNWLGNYSPKDKIRESGLWLVNELYKTPLSQADMAELQKIVK